LRDFTGLQDFQGKSFVDVGCGSGLFSYAAFELGAKRITSFDQDPLAVKCCDYMRSRAGNPNNWEVKRGSILDKGFVEGLGRYGIVYAWGVLHHTGSMWQAIANAAKLVKPEGLYYLALYNKASGLAGSSAWLRIKRLYNLSPSIGKRMLEVSYTSALTLGMALMTRDRVGRIERTAGRGMYWKTDAIDWLGGYPYEFAAPDDVNFFIAKTFPEFALVQTKLTKGLGNNWFLYENRGSG